MQHQRVESSQVHSIAYDPLEETMEARFHCQPCKKAGAPRQECPKCLGSGHTGTYVYRDVPATSYAAVRDAKQTPGGSVGQAFNLHIKKGKDGKSYPFTYHPHGS